MCGQKYEGRRDTMTCSSEVRAESSERKDWDAASPHLQDAPPLVLLAVWKQVSGEKRVAGQADSVGPVAVIFQLCTVVRALGTYYLRMGTVGVWSESLVGHRSPGRRLGVQDSAPLHSSTHFHSMGPIHGAGSWRARQDKLQLPKPPWPQKGQDTSLP